MQQIISLIRLSMIRVRDYEYSRNDKDVALLCDSVVNIRDYVQTNPITPTDQQALYDRYKSSLCKIAKVLRLHAKRIVPRNNGKKAIHLIDDVLEFAFKYVTFTVMLLDHTAAVLTEFMKGITYFETNTGIGRPMYHRDQSCGQRDLNELNCTDHGDDSDEFSKRSQKVRKCYIERLVFDRLFSKYAPTGEQELSHRYMRDETGREKMFNSCFPETVLEVDIEFTSDGGIPISLSIYTTNASIGRAETFTKTCRTYDAAHLNVDDIAQLESQGLDNVYDDAVECSRITEDRETNVVVASQKTQSFSAGPQAWSSEQFSQLGGAEQRFRRKRSLKSRQRK